MKHLQNNSDKRTDFFSKLESNYQFDEAFEQIAAKGFQENGKIPYTYLEELDRKVLTKGSMLAYFSLSVFFLIVSLSTFLYVRTSKQMELEPKPTTVAQEKKFPVQVAIIQVEKPTNQGTKKRSKTILHLQNRFKEKEIEVKQAESTEKEEILSENRLKPIRLTETLKHNATLIKKQAKTYYKFDLLCIDYRAYRKTNEFQEETELSGVDASNNSQGEELVSNERKVSYVHFLASTMNLFSKGEWKEANVRFSTILNHYPDDLNALFYGGITLLELKEQALALAQFKKIKGHWFGNFDEEADWFISRCYRELGKDDDYKAQLLKIVEQKGFYASRAAELLSKTN